MSAKRLTHVDEEGRARMVDVSAKEAGERVARARARVRMSATSARAIEAGSGPKGEALSVARLAGIQAAKQTAQLIPLAHPLPLTLVDLTASVDVQEGIVDLVSEVRTVGRTGVEMEAMTACAVAALTVYDMVKGLERGIAIEEVVLLEKRGGRSDYRREGEGEDQAPGSGEEQRDDSRPTDDRGVLRAVVITISTSKAAGVGEDLSGARLQDFAERLGAEVIAREVIPDDRATIEDSLSRWAERKDCTLVLTAGGTGLAPSDVTPEATASVIERPVPGISEAMRAASRGHTPNWMLSRALAGVREGTLIVNFPGSPASIEEVAGTIGQALAHAVDLIEGRQTRH